jgi:hypothetical protein
MSHAYAEAVDVVLYAAATDDVVRSVELYRASLERPISITQ